MTVLVFYADDFQSRLELLQEQRNSPFIFSFFFLFSWKFSIGLGPPVYAYCLAFGRD